MAQSDSRRSDAVDLSKLDNPQERAIFEEFDRRRRARTLTIPTDDVQVKTMLRRCNEPICLFGEDILDRRERLRTLLSKYSEDEVHSILHSSDEKQKTEKQEDTCAWYHQGQPELRKVRVCIADYSLRAARARLSSSRIKAARSQQEKALSKQEVHKWVQSLSMYGSQIAGSRATAYIDFAPDSRHIVTANWSGQVSIWSAPDCGEELHLQGHGTQAGCARFRPGAYLTLERSIANLASCDHDGNVHLWSLDKTKPLASLEKHESRVARVVFHPSGAYIGTTCYDASWRLFDLETQQETINWILLQEGHSRGVYDLDFHPDGSLALSGLVSGCNENKTKKCTLQICRSLDCYGRVWDLRTGKCIMYLEGHQKPVNTATWHPNGFVMLTGSGDNSIKIWDIRMRRCSYTIPAHRNLVSSVRVDPTGEYMLSSSYDCTLKLWTTTGWQPLRVLEGNNMKVMNAAISPNGAWIASACFDHTFKMWTAGDDH